MVRALRLLSLALLCSSAILLGGCGYHTNGTGNSGGNGSNGSGGSTPPPAPSFTLSLSSEALTLQAGGNAQAFSLSATALNGFSGTIAVTLSGLPNGVAATPATLTLAPGVAQKISLNAASTVAGGTMVLTVEAASGAITKSAQISLTIQPVASGFTLSIDPASLTLPIGGTAQQVNVTATASGAFSSPVNLTLTGLPAGVTATPSSLTLTPGVSQTISFQAGSSAATGETNVTFQAVAGPVSESATLTLTVVALKPDFQLFAGPSTLNLSTIVDQRMTIALIPLNGFNGVGTVTITGLPAGVAVLNPPLPLIANLPQTVTLGAGGTGAPGTAAPPGQSAVTITATAGGITHTAQVNVIVSTPAADFIPEFYAGTNPSAATPLAGLLLTPGAYTFSIQQAGTGSGALSGMSVQFSGLVPGTSLNQTQYTFSTAPEPFTITTTAGAVGERGVLQGVFTDTSTRTSHEVDFPIYVVAQPALISYVAPLTIQQGGASDLLYELASTSQDAPKIYLGQGWPQSFWLDPYLDDSNPALIEAYLGASEPKGLYSVSTAADLATGTVNLPIEFAVGTIAQTVPVQVQVTPAANFAVAAEPTTVALNGGGTQTFTVSAATVGEFSSPVGISLENLPPGVQASPQTFTLQPGDSQTVTLTTGSGYSSGGVLSVDASSGDLTHSTQVAVSPGSFTGDLAVTGNAFSGVGIAQIYTSGTYGSAPPPASPFLAAIPEYVPGSAQPGPSTSNCGGSTTNTSCTPFDVALLQSGVVGSPTLSQPGSLVLTADFGGGTQYAVLPYEQTLPDFTLNFSPASLTIPAGGTAPLGVTYSPVSSVFTQYCGSTSFTPTTFSATVMAPPPIGPLSASDDSTVSLCNPNPVTIAVPTGVPPGNYEVTVAAQLEASYDPYFNPAAWANPVATISAAHVFGVPVTVTAASAPSFQISASALQIPTTAPGGAPETISVTGSNGFTGPVSITASSLPPGVTISPSTFTVDAGSSQASSVSVAADAPLEAGEITLTGTSGSLTSSVVIAIDVSGT